MKVLLLEPDYVLRADLRALLLADASHDLKIFEAPDCLAALMFMGQHADLGVVIADFQMASACGLLRGGEFARTLASSKLVVLSAAACHAEMIAAIEQGAVAYLVSNSPPTVLQAALQMVLAGGRYFPADLMVEKRGNGWQAHASVSPKLTPRQCEVLTLIASGHSNKDIARVLGMSAGTVKVHVTAILKALNARNRTEAVVSAQHGPTARRRTRARQVFTDL